MSWTWFVSCLGFLVPPLYIKFIIILLPFCISVISDWKRLSKFSLSLAPLSKLTWNTAVTLKPLGDVWHKARTVRKCSRHKRYRLLLCLAHFSAGGGNQSSSRLSHSGAESFYHLPESFSCTVFLNTGLFTHFVKITTGLKVKFPCLSVLCWYVQCLPTGLLL